MAFVFYDTETTGVSTDFDQILQFAAIKTDLDLNEIDRFEVRCRLLPYVVPHAGALAVTGVHVEALHDPEFASHCDMMGAIEAKLAEWSPAIFVGYNSMKFDEELLRKSLFRTLRPPYLTNTNGNTRADILTLVQAVTTLRPGVIAIPTGPTGKQVMKLDQLAPANGFDHVDAHDAMGDVLATIHIAKLVKNGAPDLWDRFVNLSSKQSAAKMLLEQPAVFLTEYYFGKPYTYVVSSVGPVPGNPSAMLALDLNNDLDWVAGLNHDDLVKWISKSPKPLRRIKTNACPNIAPVAEVPEQLLSPLTMPTALNAAQRLQTDAELKERLLTAADEAKPEYEESPYIEEHLYAGGFISTQDNALMHQFHNTPWESRIGIVEQFSDARLIHHGHRLIYEHADHTLPQELKLSIEDQIWERAMLPENVKDKFASLYGALSDAETMLEDAEGETLAILNGLKGWLQEQINIGLSRN